MNCREWEKILAHHLEQGWQESGPGAPPSALPTALAAHAEGCPACAARLEAVRRLLAGPLPSPAPDNYLAARIGAHLSSAAAPRRRRLIRRLWVPALGLAAAGLFLMLTLRGLPGWRHETGGPAAELAAAEQPGVRVRFTLEAPQAARVAVVGDWNGWNARANPLGDPDGDGIWEAEIVLLPGREYRYQFTIDGRDYVPDPGAPLRIRDGFGGMNSILQL
jgi:hypothetical protein